MISYHITSYHIISYHIISYHIMPYHIISYHIISYHIIYRIVLYHNNISYHIASYHIIPYRTISYHIISYNIISYHVCIMSYLIIEGVQQATALLSRTRLIRRPLYAPATLCFLSTLFQIRSTPATSRTVGPCAAVACGPTAISLHASPPAW